MRLKSEIQGLLCSFIAWVQTQFNCMVKTLRADNGAGFTSLRSFFDSKGIVFHTSCPSTPQQNGVIERKHCHLLNVGRALRFQGNLPLTFWGQSVQTACYLINHLPTPLLNHKTLFELLHHTLPNFSHLRVFGGLCYATNLTPNINLINVLENASSLDTLLVKKATVFMISLPQVFHYS